MGGILEEFVADGELSYNSGSMWQERKSKLAANLILVFLVLTAAFFRLHRLDDLPPGLHHDEAVNGLDALTLAREGGLPLYFPENNGREPLHVYLQAGAIALFGARPWAIRLVSAYAGILAVPLLYGLALELFREEPAGKRRRLALTAAAVLSVAYWHVNLSRIGFRAIVMLPPLTLAVWWWLRGRRRQRYRYFAGAGAALGVSLYTYLPAYLTPFLLAALIPLHFVTLRGQNKARAFASTRFLLKGTLLTGLAALLLFAPLGFYFLTHAGSFGTRSSQVSVFTYSAQQGVPAGVLLANHVWQTARMFLDKGHENPTLNLPGRTAFSWLFLPGFWLGVWAALRRARRFRYALLLAWLPVMLAPAYLANEPGHPLRAAGALPAAALLSAVGFALAWDWLSRSLTTAQSRRAWMVYLLLILLAGGGLTYRDYFQKLPRLPALEEHFAAAETGIAYRMLRRPAAILAAAVYEYPTTQFILRANVSELVETGRPAAAVSAAPVYPANECRLQEEMVLFRPDGGEGRFTTLDGGALAAEGWLTAPEPAVSHDGRTGYPVWRELPVTAVAPRRALFPRLIGYNFNFQLCLVGFDAAQAGEAPDAPVVLTLLWEQLTPPLADYTAVVSMEDAFGNIAAQTAPKMITSRQDGRTNGALFTTSWSIPWPAGAPPGKYRFDIQVETSDEGPQKPPIPDIALPYGAKAETDYVTLAAPPVSLEAVSPLPMMVTAGEPPLMRLLGYTLQPDSPRPGETVAVTLYWQALRPADRNYSGFIHLLNENGALLAQQDGEPMNGKAPTSMWLAGEVIADRRELLVPPDAGDGRYTLAIGFYDWQTGERLPLVDAAGETLPDGRLLLPQPVKIRN